MEHQLMSLPTELQSRIASFLACRDAMQLLATSRAVNFSSLWRGNMSWEAAVALVKGDRAAFLAAVPTYRGRNKGLGSHFKRRDMKALFIELASALVRADIGDPKKWSLLRDWARGELPLDAKSYFAIVRAGLPQALRNDEDADLSNFNPCPEDDDARSEGSNPSTPPHRRIATAALGVVLPWRNRNGKLMYTTYAAQAKRKLPVCLAALANPAVPSHVRRAILRLHADTGRFALVVDSSEFVLGMIREGPEFTLEMMCLAIRPYRASELEVFVRVDPLVPGLVAHTFGVPEFFAITRLVHDLLVASTCKNFAPQPRNPGHFEVHKVKCSDKQRTVDRVRATFAAAAARRDGQPELLEESELVDLLEAIADTKRGDLSEGIRAAINSLTDRPRVTPEDVRALANEFRYYQPVPYRWWNLVNQLQRAGHAAAADEAERLLPTDVPRGGPNDGFGIGLLSCLYAVPPPRTRPFADLQAMREAYEAEIATIGVPRRRV
ncbi:hypothetical protein H9P43_001830 [Blastocladiella emersonii ATCC 22665]|nr:hypothetical protein H9P43_001830 [Blastocladiella emersonii ATCC 22665]